MNKEEYKNLLDLAKFDDLGEDFYQKLVDCMDVLEYLKNYNGLDETKYNINASEVAPANDEPVEGLSNKEATKNAYSKKYGFIETLKYVGE